MNRNHGESRRPTVAPIAHRQSLRESVEEALASAIISGEMPAGEVFSAPTLAEQFGVSATPVREAMLNLEKRGLVEIVRNKGFRVVEVSDAALRHIVDVRLLLEPPAMRQVAGTIPEDDFRALEHLADDILSGAESGDLRAYLAADSAFHTALTARIGNPRLTDLVSELRAQTRLPGLFALMATKELRQSAMEHHELLGLLRTGEGEKAERLMRTHISHALGWWAGRGETGGDPA